MPWRTLLGRWRVRRGGYAMVPALMAALALAAGCKPYRVEYHTRPTFYDKTIAGDLPDEITLDDGTIIRYRTPDQKTSYGRPTNERPFSIREEAEDGTITLHALLPEHILVNLLTCLRNEEYDLMWDQVLAQSTRDAFDLTGGEEDMAAYMRKYRHDLIATLNRMIAAIPHQETSFTSLGKGVTRCKLRPQISEPFKFKTVDVVKEGVELKLLTIR